MNKLKAGSPIKVIGNHMCSGHYGVVEDIDDVEGEVYIQAKLDNGEYIILRPEQYELVQ